jgi:alpha-mannosidase
MATVDDQGGVTNQVVIFDQCPHNDWDWLADFAAYFADGACGHTSVWSNFACAASAMGTSTSCEGTSTPFSYSICEMGYLQAFAASDPASFSNLVASPTNLAILGGGITSPDNLIANGESIIRDFLVGNTWILQYGSFAISSCWLPDDFGLDPQLPVLLQALGFSSVGFSRIPDSWEQGIQQEPLDPSQHSPAWTLLQTSTTDGVIDGGIDFFWQAADGSIVLAHWLQNSYCQGNGIMTSNNNDPVANITEYVYGTSGPGDECLPLPGNNLAQCLGNAIVSPTPYVFVPAGCDFSAPITNIGDGMCAWNTQQPSPSITAQTGSFTDYMTQVAAYAAANPSALHTLAFRPVPYWTGYYATRPLLKKLHNASVRALVGAEALGCLLDSAQTPMGVTASWLANRAARLAAISQGWNQVIPSNHHDFVTGTSQNAVYAGEQVPMLESTLASALSAGTLARSRIASLVNANPSPGEIAVVVANPLGFDRTLSQLNSAPVGALVSVATPAASIQSVWYSDSSQGPVQPVGDDEVLILAGAPSFGYSTVYLSPARSDVNTQLSVTTSADGTVITLENEFLVAEIANSANWGIVSLIDKATNTDVLAATGVGNDLVVYSDGGSVYVFGNEGRQGYVGWTVAEGTWSQPTATTVESGPLRARVITTATWTPTGGEGVVFTREYVLVCNEPLLRMTTTGAAPQSSSVLVGFPLPEAIQAIAQGTSSHWDDELPTIYWSDQTFQPTHDFVLAATDTSYLAGIYHLALPAWGASYAGSQPVPGNVLYGCLFRNVLGPGSQADPYCDGIQTVTYALRVPSGIESPSTGLPLQEALAYHTPLAARVVPVPPAAGSNQSELAGTLPTPYSLVSATSSPPGTSVFVAAAKPAEASPQDLVLRIYQPTNQSLTIEVTLGEPLVMTPTGLTAREQPLSAEAEAALEIKATSGGFSFTAPYAITTLSVASYLLDPAYVQG